MQQADTETINREVEQQEVENLVERFSRSPRMVELLTHICDRYFAGESNQLNELHIAVEVFGRPRDFDRSQDAIARVEAHRLRKKLRDFYQAEGKDRPVRISLPPGSYIPVFEHRNGASDGHEEAAVEKPLTEIKDLRIEGRIEPRLPIPEATPGRRRSWIAFAAAILAVGGGLAFWQIGSPGPRHSRLVPPKLAGVPLGANPQLSTVRILCGYNGPPHIGVLGKQWGPDRYYIGGRPEPSTQRFTGRTDDPFLFSRTRTGEFSYAIPLKPGTYELHLYFVEAEYGAEMGGGDMSRTFQIRLNGKILFDNFDILSDSRGPRIADERVITGVHPASDGKLHLKFISERGQPIISAIAVLPGIPHKQLPIRIVTQPISFTDHSGEVWSPDNYFLGGQMSMHRPPVTATPDPDLYARERAGDFTYAIPVDPRGTYTAKLYFAETYFGPGGPPNTGVGSRLFNVSCNGVMLLRNFDIFKEAGRCHALVKTFSGLKPTAQGKLMFWFDPVVNYASLCAIEVLDESK
ncbi:MAG: malectin domain-containing carbohydrate-binding protein [Bryobacteraceae bacterium]